MRPIPIPDEDIVPGMKRVTIGAPKGEENNVSPVEALIGNTDGGLPVMMCLVELDELDYEALKQNGNKFWIGQLTTKMAPFFMSHLLP